MSHTFSYRTDDGAEYRIHHNGDYSGEATIIVDLSKCGFSPDSPQTRTFWLPCKLLVAFAGEAVKDKITGLIEELEL